MKGAYVWVIPATAFVAVLVGLIAGMVIGSHIRKTPQLMVVPHQTNLYTDFYEVGGGSCVHWTNGEQRPCCEFRAGKAVCP